LRVFKCQEERHRLQQGNKEERTDLEDKFKSLTESILPATQVSELIDLLWSVENLDDAGAIARTAVSKLAATG
jgi:hypothetical protein